MRADFGVDRERRFVGLHGLLASATLLVEGAEIDERRKVARGFCAKLPEAQPRPRPDARGAALAPRRAIDAPPGPATLIEGFAIRAQCGFEAALRLLLQEAQALKLTVGQVGKRGQQLLVGGVIASPTGPARMSWVTHVRTAPFPFLFSVSSR